MTFWPISRPRPGSVSTHLEELLLALPRAEAGERPALLAGVRLELHTLKGNAGMMGLADQQVLAHELEDKTDLIDLARPEVQPLLSGVDRYRSLLQATREAASTDAIQAIPATSAASTALAAAEAAATSVRIPFATLDSLVDQLAEVVIVRNRLADALSGVAPHLPQGLEQSELSFAWEQLTQAHARLGTILDQLQGSVLNLRMVPLSTLFRNLSRIVHDTSAEVGKEIHFETAGADTPLDKALIELASEALGHLVRNAVIHGIEPPEERRGAGKPAAGILRLEAVASPREVRIDVLDDGGGVDREAVLAAALRRGRLPEPGEDPLELLFLPGLSTREEADLGAGRGIGLAAVRDAVERQGGRVEVASQPGRGRSSGSHLPLSASITRALLLHCDGEDYALPLRSVVESLRLEPGQIHEMNGAGVLRWRGGVLPALDLGQTFSTAAARRRQGYAVVIEDGRPAAGAPRRSGAGAFARSWSKGSTMPWARRRGSPARRSWGDGRAVLILDPAGLLTLNPAHPSRPPAGNGAMSQKRRQKGDGLPESGLASEILAAYGEAEPGETPAPTGETPVSTSPTSPAPAAQAFTGRESIYAFADSLDHRAAQENRPAERPESWVTFALADEIYALPVSHVQEILRINSITRVPHAPVPVRGITNLRGRVLAIVDLRVRLGLAAAETGPDSRILVTEARGRSIGLLVDAARQVLKLLPSAIQEPPSDILSERSDFLYGVYHLDHELIILLDVARVLLVEDTPAPAST